MTVTHKILRDSEAPRGRRGAQTYVGLALTLFVVTCLLICGVAGLFRVPVNDVAVVAGVGIAVVALSVVLLVELSRDSDAKL